MMALKLGGSTIKEIVHTQSEILRDPVLVKSVTDRLKQHETLEQVIDVVFSEHIARMEETGNTQAVLDGEIDAFIASGIRWRRQQAAAS